MEQNIELSNFTAGEFSPKLKGRTDLEKYFNALDTELNMVTMPQGGATRRPPTRFVAKNKDQTNVNRPVRFIFSTDQAYILEYSHLNVRVYKDRGVVLNVGVPVDIVTTYTTSEIAALKFTQSADTLYNFHPDHPPASLTRSSHVIWVLSTIFFRDGPYLDINITPTTLTPSGTAGSITLTASSTVGINGGQGFLATDVGRLVRLKLYSLWAWLLITAYTDTTHVTAMVQDKVQFGAAGAIDGAAWTVATDYQVAEVVLCNGRYYRCRQAGTSAPSGTGPNGTGTTIIDGSCVWSLIGGYNAVPWAGNTGYAVDVVVNANGNSYQAIIAGFSAGVGTGPSGTGNAIVDNTVTWRYLPPFAFPTATKTWALGAWSETTGYPADGGFWQGRLHFAAPRSQPNRIDGSVVGDFTNMAPTTADGTVTDANAISWTLDDDEVNAIHWLAPAGSAQAMQLAMGTDGNEHVLQAASSAQALTPTSVQAYRETSYGSARNVEPLRIGKALLFVDRPGRKLREFSFFWQVNGYVAPDILEFSEHITRGAVGSPAEQSGIKWKCYQQSPFQVIWAGLNGGGLIGITYDREQQLLAPHRHQLGGNFYGGPPVVEYGAIIPSADAGYDELWLSVKRTIDGVVVRTMEVMEPFFDGGDRDYAFFGDCCLSSELTYPAATLTVSGLTANAPPEVLPETMPPFFNGTGDFRTNADVFASNSVGRIIRTNAGKAIVKTFVDARHVTAEVLRPLLSLAPAATGDWSMKPLFTTMTGLDHLEGESVVVLGDGAVFNQQAVIAGEIALAGDGASLVHAGLPYTPVLITMPWEPKAAAGAATHGKMKRVDTLWIRFHETLGCAFGRRMTDDMTGVAYDMVEPIESRSASDVMGQAPPLFSGVLRLSPQGGHDREGQVIVTHNQPLPMTVLGIYARGDVGEMDP